MTILSKNFLFQYQNANDNKYVYSLSMVLYTFIYLMYFIIMNAKYGQTLGKMAMGIKIVDLDEITTIGLKRATIRQSPFIIITIISLVSTIIFYKQDIINEWVTYQYIISLIIFGWLIIEVIYMLTNDKRRTIHDLLAKDVVIKIRNSQ